MEKRKVLSEIFHRNWAKISFVYSILIFESVVFALVPWLCGRAIDDLLSGQCQFFVNYILLLSFALVTGMVRRMLDTRVFASVWAGVTVETICDLIEQNEDSAKVISRAGLSDRFVDFFEFRIPLLGKAIVHLIVGYVMLWSAVEAVSLIVFGVGMLAVLWGCHLIKLRKILDHTSQDSIDKANQAIQDKDLTGVRDCYRIRKSCYIKWSDFDAWSWGFQDLAGVISEVVVVLVLVEHGASPGVILATMSYVWSVHENMTCFRWFFGALKETEVAEERISQGN